MIKKLNAFQVIVLEELSRVMPSYIDVGNFISAWLTNNLSDSEETVNSWMEQLVNEGYAVRRNFDPSVFSWLSKPNRIFESSEIKIEQKGRDYLAMNKPQELDIASGSDSSENESKKLSLIECAILHVYLGMFDTTKQISKNNNKRIAKDECGFVKPSSGAHLYQEYVKFLVEDYRLSIHETNRKSANVFLKRYDIILPILKKQSPKGFQVANADLKKLQQEYDRWYV